MPSRVSVSWYLCSPPDESLTVAMTVVELIDRSTLSIVTLFSETGRVDFIWALSALETLEAKRGATSSPAALSLKSFSTTDAWVGQP
jgi:hypothetical protein